MESITRSVNVIYAQDPDDAGRGIEVTDLGLHSLPTAYVSPLTSNDRGWHKVSQGYKRLFILSQTPISIQLAYPMPPVVAGSSVSVFPYTNTPVVRQPAHGLVPSRLQVRTETIMETLVYSNDKSRKIKYETSAPPRILTTASITGAVWDADSGSFVLPSAQTGALVIEYQVRGEVWLVPYDFRDISRSIPFEITATRVAINLEESMQERVVADMNGADCTTTVIIKNQNNAMAYTLKERVAFHIPAAMPFGGGEWGQEEHDQATLDFLNRQIGELAQEEETASQKLAKSVGIGFKGAKQVGSSEHYTVEFETEAGAKLSLDFESETTYTEINRATTEVDVPDESGYPSGVKVERIDSITLESEVGHKLTLIFNGWG